MLGDVRGLLVYGIAAAKAGDKTEARRYLECVLFNSASPHIGEVETEEMILPEGSIPFAVTEEDAQKTFRRWLDKNVDGKHVHTTRVRGIYLPAWTFGSQPRDTVERCRKRQQPINGIKLRPIAHRKQYKHDQHLRDIGKNSPRRQPLYQSEDYL